MVDQFIYTRLLLPRPLSVDTVTALLSRLMGPDVPRPLAFETWASPEGIRFLLGCAATALSRLKRLVGAMGPGCQFEPARGPVWPDGAVASRVATRPGGLPLSPAHPEQIALGFFAGLAARRDDEQVGLQLVLGRVHRPSRPPQGAADPLQPVIEKLCSGVRPVPADIARQLRDHQAQPRLDAVIRIAAAADTSRRRQALTWEAFGPLAVLESPGTHLTLMRDSPARWSRASVPHTALCLTAAELVPLIGWPIGEQEYPGVPGVSPRLLPVSEIVSRSQGLIALATLSGSARPVGLPPRDRLQHLVLLGPTGSGKSTVLEHLALDDIAAGRACVVIDPKRQLVDAILERTPPQQADRVVVLDAADDGPVVGFNPLDCTGRDADVVVDCLLAVLAAVFKDGWGPRTEYLVQGGLLSLARAGQARSVPYTLLDLPRLLTDPTLRRTVVGTRAIASDATLAAFWAEYESLRPAARAAQIAPVLNKLRKLLLRRHLARVLGQPSPRFRLRDVFRQKAIVLVPLNEALLGTGSARLLGSLIASELWLATLERAAEPHPERQPAFVIVDEVQNYLHLPTPVEDVLAVSRSYGVGWQLAHQYRTQLTPALQAGIDANARNKLCFALEPDDAHDMARQAPDLIAEDFQQLPRYQAYARLMAGGTRTAWCSLTTLPPSTPTGIAEQIRGHSRRRYGLLPDGPDSPATGARTTTQVGGTTRGATSDGDGTGLRPGQRVRQP